ncbi:hypothetical protein FQN57_003448 [Myotisia sp. PD_48]|nr:hypothetical protein FQN57_003448 [Myotisia sp. PD_48]
MNRRYLYGGSELRLLSANWADNYQVYDELVSTAQELVIAINEYIQSRLDDQNQLEADIDQNREIVKEALQQVRHDHISTNYQKKTSAAKTTDSLTLAFNVKDSDTIAELKTLVEEKIGCEISCVRVNQMSLNNDSMLVDYDLREGSVVCLTLRRARRENKYTSSYGASSAERARVSPIIFLRITPTKNQLKRKLAPVDIDTKRFKFDPEPSNPDQYNNNNNKTTPTPWNLRLTFWDRVEAAIERMPKLTSAIRPLFPLEKQQEVVLRGSGANFNLTRAVNIEAGTMQTRGDICSPPCKHCGDGNGPFTECGLVVYIQSTSYYIFPLDTGGTDSYTIPILTICVMENRPT